MQESSNSSRADRIRKPLLVPGNSSSDPLCGNSPTASSADTYIQIGADAEHPYTDGADSLTPPSHPIAPAVALDGLANSAPDPAHPAGGDDFLPRPEGFAETAGSSGRDVVMDVLTTQEPVTANGTASGGAKDGDARSASVSPQPTRESGHGDVPTDVEEVLPGPVTAAGCTRQWLTACCTNHIYSSAAALHVVWRAGRPVALACLFLAFLRVHTSEHVAATSTAERGLALNC